MRSIRLNSLDAGVGVRGWGLNDIGFLTGLYDKICETVMLCL